MARIPTFDPLTSEARSPLIAGITEALNKLSGTLGSKTATVEDLVLNEVYITENDRFRIYQAPLGKKLWLSTPEPVFKKNGSVITESTDNFTIDYVGGSIVFNIGYTLSIDDVVTVSCTYIAEGSETVDAIMEAIASVEGISNQFKGYYGSFKELDGSIPDGDVGDFAVVGGTDNNVYLWNSTTNQWEPVFRETDLSNYYNKQEANNLLNSKEPTISKQGDTADSDNYFYGGRKTWVSIFGKVLATVLTGLSTETGGQVTASDSVLTAIGKLQKQLNDSLPPILGTSEPTTSTSGKIGQEYINTSNGNKYYLVSIYDGEYNWKKYGSPALSFSVTLSSSGWSGNNQTVLNDLFVVDGYDYIVTTDVSNYTEYNNSIVRPLENVERNGELTFTCGEVPISDLKVNILRMEVYNG